MSSLFMRVVPLINHVFKKGGEGVKMSELIAILTYDPLPVNGGVN